MTKTKVILIVSFVLVFAAGAALGVLLARPEKPPPHPSSWLAAELDLSAEQRKQMEAIWSDAMGATFARHGEKRAAVVQERDQAIQALLSEAQQAQYQAIQQDYTRKMNELSQERKRAFDDAVERTKRILTPEQATKYEELMKKHRERGMGPGPGGFRGRRRPPPLPNRLPTNDPPPTVRSGSHRYPSEHSSEGARTCWDARHCGHLDCPRLWHWPWPDGPWRRKPVKGAGTATPSRCASGWSSSASRPWNA